MSSDPDQPAPRARNADATREAILTSARRAFAASGYDGAGLREIAAGAGVTAMMVNRYFGSKEQLFAQVVEQTVTRGSVIAGGVMDQAHPGRALAEAVIGFTRAGAAPLDGFAISLHSASNPRAVEIGREKIVDHHLATVAKALEGDMAQSRAALMLAIISGVQIMRQMFTLPGLADANEAHLTELLAKVFDGLINPQPDAANSEQ